MIQTHNASIYTGRISTRRLAALGVAALLGASGCSSGLDAPSGPTDIQPVSPVDRGLRSIRGPDLAAHIATLASDEFEGRFPGTAGEAKTVAYISAALARSGVEPAVNGSFLQNVPLLASSADSTTRLFVSRDDPNSSAGPVMELAFADDILVATPHPSGAASVRDSPIVFVGHGIVAPEYEWNDYAGVDVAGKTVIVLGNDPGLVSGDQKLFKGRALTHYGTFLYKTEQAARLGARAVLMIHDPSHTGLGWQVFADHTTQTRYRLATPSATPKPDVQGLLHGDRAAALFSLANLDLAALKRAASERGFRAQALPLLATIDLASESRPVTSHNVVGVLRGSARPDEYVIYTAHWDHVGVSKTGKGATQGDMIFNGAVDNATGTAALLELAQAYAELPTPPARSIVFLATTAEEQGLLGSWYYAENPIYPLRHTVAVINMDALFPFGETKGMTVVALGSSEIEEYMSEAASVVGRKLYPDPSPEAGAFFRSDHYPFAKNGVPAIFAVGGPAADKDAGETVDVQRYIDYVTRAYHKPADEYDPETWDMAGIVQDVKIYFHTGYHIAMDSRFPNWYPTSEFRAIRDAMRSRDSGRR